MCAGVACVTFFYLVLSVTSAGVRVQCCTHLHPPAKLLQFTQCMTHFSQFHALSAIFGGTDTIYAG